MHRPLAVSNRPKAPHFFTLKSPLTTVWFPEAPGKSSHDHESISDSLMDGAAVTHHCLATVPGWALSLFHPNLLENLTSAVKRKTIVLALLSAIFLTTGRFCEGTITRTWLLTSGLFADQDANTVVMSFPSLSTTGNLVSVKVTSGYSSTASFSPGLQGTRTWALSDLSPWIISSNAVSSSWVSKSDKGFGDSFLINKVTEGSDFRNNVIRPVLFTKFERTAIHIPFSSNQSPFILVRFTLGFSFWNSINPICFCTTFGAFFPTHVSSRYGCGGISTRLVLFAFLFFGLCFSLVVKRQRLLRQNPGVYVQAFRFLFSTFNQSLKSLQ